MSAAFTLVHFVPVSSFDNFRNIDLTGIFNRVRSTPIATSNDNRRINFIGVYSESNDKTSKFQLFRNGVTEYVTTRILRENRVSSGKLYDELKKTVSYALQNYRSIEIIEPVYMMVSFYGVNGLLARDIHVFDVDHEVVPFESDKMIFPEVLIEDIDNADIRETIRPIMDILWNAYGFSKYSYELK